MEGFKLTSASATADEALAAADQLEQAVGEICNGKRRASNVPMEPMAVLVQFARDNGHLAALLDRTQSENEALAQRLAVRMEELQQAVQARLAAEQQVGQLLAALTSARRELQACQAVIHLAGGFDPAYVTGAKAALSQADAAIAAVKGGAA